MILIDASVWLAAVDGDDRFHEPARALLAAPAVRHAALDLTLYEVGNIAVRRWRDADQAERLCRIILAACQERIVRVHDDLVEEAVRIADQHEITVYDAAYVAAARAHRCQLVSGDIADLVGRELAVAPDAVELN